MKCKRIIFLFAVALCQVVNADDGENQPAQSAPQTQTTQTTPSGNGEAFSYRQRLDELTEALRIARLRFPVGEEPDNVIGGLAEIESGRARSPQLFWLVGLSGSGKTTGVEETIKIARVDQQRVIPKRMDPGDVVFDFTPLYKMLPPTRGRLMAIVEIDEILSMAPYSQLLGPDKREKAEPLPPPPPPDLGDEDDDETEEERRERRRLRREHHAALAQWAERHAAIESRVRSRMEEEIARFYESEKGRRIKMWMELQDILGSGTLLIPLEMINSQLGDVFETSYTSDFGTQFSKSSRSLNPLESIYERLSQYGREDKQYRSDQAKVDRLNQEIETLTANITTNSNLINGELRMAHQRDHQAFQVANNTYQHAVQALAQRMASQPSPRGDESDSNDPEEKSGLVAILKTAMDEARVADDAARKAYTDTQTQIQKDQTRIQNAHEELARFQEYANQELRKRDEAGNKVRRAVAKMLDLDPEYFRRLEIDPELGVEEICQKLFANAMEYSSRIKGLGTTMPRVFAVNFVNTLFFFIGNPPNILREVKSKFATLNPKTPDALRKMINDDTDFNTRLRAEISAILGLDEDVLREDPDIPEQLKVVIIQKMDALRDRLGITGIKFKMPPSNAEYDQYLQSWLAQTQLTLADLNEGRKVTIHVDPIGWQVLFTAVVDPIGQLRRTSDNYLRIMRRVNTQLEIMVRSHHKLKKAIAVHLNFVDLEGGDLRAEVELRDPKDNVLNQWSQIFSKPLMSWQVSEWNGLKSTDQTALQLAAQIVVGLYQFRSLPLGEISTGMRVDREIDRKYWRNIHHDITVAIGQMSLLLAGPLIELSSGKEERILRLSEPARSQLASAQGMVTQLVSALGLSELDYVSLFGGLPKIERDLKTAIIRKALGVEPGSKAALDPDNFLSLVRRKTASILERHYDLVALIAEEIRESGTLRQETLVNLLRQHAPEIDPGDESLFSAAVIDEIANSTPGSISSRGAGRTSWLAYASCDEFLAATETPPSVVADPHVPAPGPINPQATDGHIRKPTGRATVNDLLDEAGALFRDVQKILGH